MKYTGYPWKVIHLNVFKPSIPSTSALFKSDKNVGMFTSFSTMKTNPALIYSENNLKIWPFGIAAF